MYKVCLRVSQNPFPLSRSTHGVHGVVDHPDRPGEYLTPAELEAYLSEKQEEQAKAQKESSVCGGGTEVGATSVHPASLGRRVDPPTGDDAEFRAEGVGEVNVLASSRPWLNDMIERGLGSGGDSSWGNSGRSEGRGAGCKLKALGNERYKAGDFFEAIRLYGRAICYCPLDDTHNHSRAVFHSNRAACHLAIGRYEQCIDDCSIAIDLDPRYVRALMRRAKAYEKLERLEDAVEDLDAAVAVDSSYAPALQEQRRVKQLYHEKTEKMKEEMLGKLKGLGNSILGKFGMSLDNFKLKPQEGGGYSVSYEQ